MALGRLTAAGSLEVKLDAGAGATDARVREHPAQHPWQGRRATSRLPALEQLHAKAAHREGEQAK
ncbi:MAG TPA: hypothetical protein VF523_17785, partial [Burkholderiales bacterium]